MHVRIKGTYMRIIPRCTYVPGTSGEQVKPNTKVQLNRRTYVKNVLRGTCVPGTSRLTKKRT